VISRQLPFLEKGRVTGPFHCWTPNAGASSKAEFELELSMLRESQKGVL